MKLIDVWKLDSNGIELSQLIITTNLKATQNLPRSYPTPNGHQLNGYFSKESRIEFSSLNWILYSCTIQISLLMHHLVLSFVLEWKFEQINKWQAMLIIEQNIYHLYDENIAFPDNRGNFNLILNRSARGKHQF